MSCPAIPGCRISFSSNEPRETISLDSYSRVINARQLTWLEERADEEGETDDGRDVEKDEKCWVEDVDTEPGSREVSKGQTCVEQKQHLQMIHGEQSDVVQETESRCIFQLLTKATRFLFDDSGKNQRNANENGEDDEVESKLIDLRRNWIVGGRG